MLYVATLQVQNIINLTYICVEEIQLSEGNINKTYAVMRRDANAQLKLITHMIEGSNHIFIYGCPAEIRIIDDLDYCISS